MFCTKCGTKHDDDARFCTNCGSAVNLPQPSQNQQPPILSFEEKAKLLFDYSDELMADDSLPFFPSDNPEKSAKFLRFYQDVNSQKRVSMAV